MTTDDVAWVRDVREGVLEFLERQRETDGFYRFSLSGDRYPPASDWGLANTVFVARSYYLLDELTAVSDSEIEAMTTFIRSFHDGAGRLYDASLEGKNERSILLDIGRALKHRDIDFLRTDEEQREQRQRAETRQSATALAVLGSHPPEPYLHIPYTTAELDAYLSSLNWAKPWGAGSQFSHLVYFYRRNSELFGSHSERADALIDHATEWVDTLQSETDGCWYRGTDVPSQQRINGAAKVLAGFGVAGYDEIDNASQIIDYCLANAEITQACDGVDVIAVLFMLTEKLSVDYRRDDIRVFCRDWLDICRRHYHHKPGGFSFFEDQANTTLYGLTITEGRDEPDVHGTFLLTRGLSMVAEILDFPADLAFRQHPFIYADREQRATIDR